jgi:hypothetical protein
MISQHHCDPDNLPSAKVETTYFYDKDWPSTSMKQAYGKNLGLHNCRIADNIPGTATRNITC